MSALLQPIAYAYKYLFKDLMKLGRFTEIVFGIVLLPQCRIPPSQPLSQCCAKKWRPYKYNVGKISDKYACVVQHLDPDSSLFTLEVCINSINKFHNVCMQLLKHLFKDLKSKGISRKHHIHFVVVLFCFMQFVLL